MKERIKIQDTTLIGNWDEVQDYELSKVTKKDTDTQKLNGLIIKGYETKFSKVNENGERYEPGCLDEFIQSYFIDNGLNMVVDVQHGWGIDDQVGRVVYLETNTVGFYFVAYIPRTVARYEQIKNLLRRASCKASASADGLPTGSGSAAGTGRTSSSSKRWTSSRCPLSRHRQTPSPSRAWARQYRTASSTVTASMTRRARRENPF
jgi:hypothetical protein